MFQLYRVLFIVIEHVWISNVLRCVTWKLRPEKALSQVKRWVITLVFANWRVVALEETFLSMCWSSRALIFCFNNKTEWQMFVLLYARHTKLYKFGWHTSANNTQMKNRRDLILGEVVYTSFSNSLVIQMVISQSEWPILVRCMYLDTQWKSRSRLLRLVQKLMKTLIKHHRS